MRRKYSLLYTIVIFTLMLASGCSPVRRLPPDAYLLNSVKIKVDKSDVKKSDIRARLKQSPNKRMLGSRFHLWLYNRANPLKDNKFHNGLRNAGEAPVIWDSYATSMSVQQILGYLNTKGYYGATIEDTTWLRRRKAIVSIEIHPGWHYRIGNVNYSIPDPAVSRLILSDTLQSLIRYGQPFDHELLENERDRIEDFMRNKGYYDFYSDYVYFNVDTVPHLKQANLEIVVGNARATDASGKLVTVPHIPYRINNVTVDMTDNPSLTGNNSISDIISTCDTVIYNNVSFLISGTPFVRPNALRNALSLRAGELYSLTREERTYRNLTGLRTFKLATIQYYKSDSISSGQSNEGALNSIITLSPYKKHSLTAEVEATTSKGDLGGGVTFNYQNKSLFRGAEIFDVRTKVASESFDSRGVGLFNTYSEYALDLSVTLPKFLLPGKIDSRLRYINPKTKISGGFNYLKRPEYRRTVTNLGFAYSWRIGRNFTHTLKPLDLYYIDSDLSDAYRDRIKGMYIEKSYVPHTIISASYGFAFSNQVPGVKRDYVQVLFNIESAGAMQSAVYSMYSSKNNEIPHTMFGSPWAQYIKTDIDVRFNQLLRGIADGSSIVYRLFLGMGVPYDNSKVLPFQKQYYSGGAFGIRGWRIRSLGPGSYEDNTAYNNSTGDIRLEFNVEHRFKLFWILNGALFADAGNIWDFRRDPMRDGANFSLNRFYREIALSGGAGLRFDFDFVIGRIDVGLKGRDPRTGWIWGKRPVEWGDFAFNFGIGYPF